jgi:DNA-binding MarR family transcriptional regulator
VLCFATAKGLRVLAELDPRVNAADEAAMTGLGAEELRTLLDLLDDVRAANAVSGAPRSAAVAAG